MDMMWLSLGTLSFFAPVLSWMTQCLSYIFSPLDSQVMSSHALSYQSMMPVHAPQVNATTMVVVSINALWSRRQSTRLSLKHIIAAITCWLVVAFRDRTFFLLSLTPPRTFKFHSSVCNIHLGIHLSWYVDGLDSGRVLLHPNPVFLSIKSRTYESIWSWCHLTESWEQLSGVKYFYS
jgi:hypothetical protein